MAPRKEAYARPPTPARPLASVLKVDPEHFKTTALRDYCTPAIEPVVRKSTPPVSIRRTVAAPDHFKSSNLQDYPAYGVEHYTPRRSVSATPKATPAKVVESPQISTSRQDYAPPTPSAFSASRPAIKSIPSVKKADPGHFTSSNQSAFKGEQNPKPARTPFSSRKVAPAKVSDPSHYQTTKQSDYQVPAVAAMQPTAASIRRTRSAEPTHVDPSHFLSSNARDYVAYADQGRSASRDRPNLKLTVDTRGFKTEYTATYTPKVSPPRKHSPPRKATVTHVSPSHFETSSHRDFAPPPASAYRSASASISRQRSLSHAPADHYVSESRRAYA
eukprot:GDKJ01036851.1.p1 GENE.GDKJ01036851.1~~GDKJ01036851.1.p1  ORF type:complete len:331 (+),score=-16.24 GDKJ01036851.1:60-1052(+)